MEREQDFDNEIEIDLKDFSCNSLDIKFFFFFVGRARRKRGEGVA